MAGKRVPHDPDEVIAIINNRDEVIGKATRREAHKDRSMHRVAAVIIRNRNDELLLQQRSDDSLLDYSAGGHFRWDMTPIEGAVKETYEELGINIPASMFRRVGSWTIPGNPLHMFTVFEVIGNWGLDDFNIDTKEVKSIRYYTIPEIREMLQSNRRTFTSGFRYSLKRYIEAAGI